MNKRQARKNEAAFVLGAFLIIGGVAWLSIPWAFIVAGALILSLPVVSYGRSG